MGLTGWWASGLYPLSWFIALGQHTADWRITGPEQKESCGSLGLEQRRVGT